MHKTTDRNAGLPVRDALVVAVAVAILAWCWWPRGEALRCVRVTEGDGEVRDVSLRVTDPRLAVLEHRIRTWDVPEPVASIAIHRWAIETARHYETLSGQEVVAEEAVTPVQADISGGVQPVGFRRETSAPSPNRSRTGWSDVAKRNEAALQRILGDYERRRRSLGPPPVQLLGTVRGPLQSGFGPATPLLALACVALFALWYRWRPPLRLQRLGAIDDVAMGTPRETATDDLLPVIVPADWIELHQPWSVQSRGFAMVVLAGAATVSLIAVMVTR